MAGEKVVTYTLKSPKGHPARVVLKRIPGTGRYEVIVQGRVVGSGFADVDDAHERAAEYVRNPADSPLGGID